MHAYYYQADGAPKPVGTRLQNPVLAKLLKSIARQGAEAYYTGPAAARAAAAISGAPLSPVPVTAGDFAGYRAIERPAVCGGFRPMADVCGSHRQEAIWLIGELERLTA